MKKNTIRLLLLSLTLLQSFVWADNLRLYNLGELLLDYDVSSYPEVMARINKTAEAIEGADLVIGNLETAVQPGGLSPKELDALRKNPSLTFTHHTQKSSLDILIKNLKVNFITLANNHSFDLGTEGLIAGLEAAEEKKLAHAGTGYNISEARGYELVEVNGKKIAFFAFTNFTIMQDKQPYPGSLPTQDSSGIHYIHGTTGNWEALAKKSLLQSIEKLKVQQKVDYVFVYAHIHYTSKSTRPWGADGNYPTTISREIIDAGADAFFIEGPHSPKAFEV